MTAKKRTSLDAIFSTSKSPEVPERPKSAGGEGMEAASQPISKGKGPERSRPKRPSVKQHTAYLPLAVHEQLRKLAFEENRKIHAYLLEGLDRVFAERGLPAIEDLQ